MITLSTYTDYVNPYPSVIQTTSYNFTKTETTPEVCAGVIKAVPKIPAQHAADLDMLTKRQELHNAFYNNEGLKKILCARVDGAADEGPVHEEIQFFG